jgi:8-oxo-dGTP diphosphatase
LTIYLVRHVKAGERGLWLDDDRLRPISKTGQRQARGLVDVLQDARFERIVSSPYVRCIESVAPLASVRGLSIEVRDALAEEAPLGEARALFHKYIDVGAVLCSHGDVIPMLLHSFAKRGVDLGPDAQWPKGCTWALETNAAGDVTEARYLSPPAE